MAFASRQADRLKGARILIADDELLIALDIEDMIVGAGAEAVGPCTTLASTLSAIEKEELSAAILDVRLGRDTSEAAARRLVERNTPFLFYTGQSLPAEIRALSADAVVLSKPANSQSLVAALQKLIGG